MTTELIIPITVETKEIYTKKGVTVVLSAIDKKIKEFGNPPTETKKERSDRKAFKMKLTRTRTFLEKTGKEFVAEKKAAIKIFDSGRKSLRDGILEREETILKPVTEYEDAEKERIEKERQLEIFNLDHEEAIGMDDLFNREKALAEKEAEMERQEEEKRQKEEAERLKKEQIEREERLKQEAAETARREAEETIRLEKEKSDRLSREAKEAKEQAEIDRVAAIEQAKLEKERAIQKAKDDAQAKMEADKKAEDFRIAEEKKVADRKASNLNHQRKINREALEDLMTIFDENKGKEIISALVNNQIRHISINY